MAGRPRYRLIAEQLERRIAAGHYDPAQPLPTEPVFEKEFGVSRITVRQALGRLKQRGLLYSQSGKGTMIRALPSGRKSFSVTGLISDLVYYAAETTYSPLKRIEVTPPKDVAKVLGLAPGEKVTVMTGTRAHANEAPFAVEEVYCPTALSADIDNRDLRGRAIFSLIEQNNGMQITEVIQEITAVQAPADVRTHLKLKPKHCVLLATRKYKTEDGRIVEVGRTHYDTARFKYVTTLYSA